MVEAWEERTHLLLGEEKLTLLQNAHVLVVGLGGVGAYAAEMICRAGVGEMTIVDADIISLSNINRQLIALHSTVNRDKGEILSDRLKDINPEIKLTVIKQYIKEENVSELLDMAKYNFVIDAIDTLSPKVSLIKGSLDRGYPLVSSMGVGGKIDPALIEITDIEKSHHCTLAFMLRKRLHRQGIRSGFSAVFSTEEIREGSMILTDEENKRSNVGTMSYMPAVFGCHCASVAIRVLLGETLKNAKRG